MTTDLNPVFGKKKIDKAGSSVTDFAGTDDYITDMVSRKMGITRAVREQTRFSLAVTDGKKYLEDKQADLLKIAGELSTEFKAQFLKYEKMGYSDEKSKKLAFEYLEKIKKSKMEAHNAEFPTHLTDKVVSAMTRKAALGGDGKDEKLEIGEGGK